MPKAFTDCVKGGGRVRTISGPDKKFDLGENEFVRVCFSGGGMVRGEKKRNKKAERIGRGKGG